MLPLKPFLHPKADPHAHSPLRAYAAFPNREALPACLARLESGRGGKVVASPAGGPRSRVSQLGLRAGVKPSRPGPRWGEGAAGRGAPRARASALSPLALAAAVPPGRVGCGSVLRPPGGSAASSATLVPAPAARRRCPSTPSGVPYPPSRRRCGTFEDSGCADCQA